MRKLLILSIFSFVTPLFLILTISLYFYFGNSKNTAVAGAVTASSNTTVAYAALPVTGEVGSVKIGESDARTELVRQFFQRYNSPLVNFAQNVVSAADEYGLDFRYIPAIAMQESNLCKKAIPGTYNCWGFGIYGSKITGFESYSQAIDVVTKTLAKDYKNRGLETPTEIQSRYNPSNHNNWAQAVSGFMSELE